MAAETGNVCLRQNSLQLISQQQKVEKLTRLASLHISGRHVTLLLPCFHVSTFFKLRIQKECIGKALRLRLFVCLFVFLSLG